MPNLVKLPFCLAKGLAEGLARCLAGFDKPKYHQNGVGLGPLGPKAPLGPPFWWYFGLSNPANHLARPFARPFARQNGYLTEFNTYAFKVRSMFGQQLSGPLASFLPGKMAI